MKTVIVYESTHHGNTFKLVQAIKQKYEMDIVNVQECAEKDLAANTLTLCEVWLMTERVR